MEVLDLLVVSALCVYGGGRESMERRSGLEVDGPAPAELGREVRSIVPGGFSHCEECVSFVVTGKTVSELT